MNWYSRTVLLSLAIHSKAQAGADCGPGTVLMDEAAFYLFYHQTGPRLLGYLNRCLGDQALAEDLLQEAFVKFLRCGFVGRDESERSRYVFKIATNLVRDHFRARKGTEVEFNEGSLPQPLQTHPERDSAVNQALGALAPRDRAMVWLAHVEGLTPREIAQTLGLKASSMKSMMFRARRRFASKLREFGLGPAGEKRS